MVFSSLSIKKTAVLQLKYRSCFRSPYTIGIASLGKLAYPMEARLAEVFKPWSAVSGSSSF